MALQLDQASKFEDAERRYRAFLSVAPNHPNDLHFLSALLHQWGRREDE